MTRFRERYQQVYSSLTRADLQKGSEGLAELSAGPDLFGYDSDLWLGFYTHEGVRTALEKYGFNSDLEALGFDETRVEIKTNNPDQHLLRVWSEKPSCDEPLVELVVRRDFLRPYSELADQLTDSHIPVLTVDWLLLQNPTAGFTEERPPLPGQEYPGLGVGAQVLELLRNVCLRLKLAGLATVPSHFHNALFYSAEFRHFDPHWQGAFLALCRDLMPAVRNSVTAASWGLHWKMIKNRNDPDTPFGWFQQLMIAPISELLSDYFASHWYQRQVQKSLTEHDFEVFDRALERNLATRGLEPFDRDKLDETESAD